MAGVRNPAQKKDMLRVSVEGGGCSGFEYRFDLVSNAEPEDVLIERAGAKVLVDSLSPPT